MGSGSAPCCSQVRNVVARIDSAVSDAGSNPRWGPAAAKHLGGHPKPAMFVTRSLIPRRPPRTHHLSNLEGGGFPSGGQEPAMIQDTWDRETIDGAPHDLKRASLIAALQWIHLVVEVRPVLAVGFPLALKRRLPGMRQVQRMRGPLPTRSELARPTAAPDVPSLTAQHHS